MVVDARRDVPGELEVLLLVLADGHHVAVVEQDVRGHEHRVVGDARGDGLAVALLLHGLVGVAPEELPRGDEAAEDPAQLEDLDDVALAVEHRLAGVQAAGEPGRGDVEHRLPQRLRVPFRREGVVVRDEVEGAVLLLQRECRPDGAEVVPQVRGARGLDAGERGLHEAGSVA